MRPLYRVAGLLAALPLTLLHVEASAIAVSSAGAVAAKKHVPSVQPLERAHAHNDYEHERPLLDALSHGFTSVEADVYLVDGQLLVAHDPEDLDPSRTLQSLYLDPLRRIVHRNGGSVYRKWDGSLQLLIDIKNTGAGDLHRARPGTAPLPQHPDHLEGRQGSTSGAVTVVISGDRPRELMESQRVRFAGYDGRLSDLGSGTPATFMPLVSDNWTRHFTVARRRADARRPSARSSTRSSSRLTPPATACASGPPPTWTQPPARRSGASWWRQVWTTSTPMTWPACRSSCSPRTRPSSRLPPPEPARGGESPAPRDGRR
jgi:hypothetical protein